MQAKEFMTFEVVSIDPDAAVPNIAALLLKHRISAVPVVDAAGAPIGMVSEGDLLGRSELEPERRVDWWLTLLAEGETLNPDFIAALRKSERKARDIMSKPLISVDETTEASEIARLISAHHIKRVPVIRDGRIIGIVSRADLLNALVAEVSAAAKAQGPSYLAGVLSELDQHFLHRRQSHAELMPTGAADAADDGKMPTVVGFQALGRDFVHIRQEQRDEVQRAALESQHHLVKEMTDHHIDDASWKAILHHAREAAEHGDKQFLLLRFPIELCSDGGRAINAPLAEWPQTLRGEAAEIYRRWEKDLKPQGFHIVARVLEFPNGFPGDIGLSLLWNE
jgi:CBS domain-containing protein